MMAKDTLPEYFGVILRSLNESGGASPDLSTLKRMLSIIIQSLSKLPLFDAVNGRNLILKNFKDVLLGVAGPYTHREANREHRKFGLGIYEIEMARPLMVAVAMSDDDRFKNLNDADFIARVKELVAQEGVFLTPDYRLVMPTDSAVEAERLDDSISVEVGLGEEVESATIDDPEPPFRFKPLPTSEIFKESIRFVDARGLSLPESFEGVPGSYCLMNDGQSEGDFKLIYFNPGVTDGSSNQEKVSIPGRHILDFLGAFGSLKSGYAESPVIEQGCSVYHFSGEQIYELIGKYGHLWENDSDFLLDKILEIQKLQGLYNGVVDKLSALRWVQEMLEKPVETGDSLFRRLEAVFQSMNHLVQEKKIFLNSLLVIQSLKAKYQALGGRVEAVALPLPLPLPLPRPTSHWHAQRVFPDVGKGLSSEPAAKSKKNLTAGLVIAGIICLAAATAGALVTAGVLPVAIVATLFLAKFVAGVSSAILGIGGGGGSLAGAFWANKNKKALKSSHQPASGDSGPGAG
jgi:hypothetical protein